MLAGVSAQGEDAGYFYRLPPTWLEQLKHDSGWNTWQGLDPSMDPATRAMMAVGMSAGRYAETPESERVLSPPDAIKQLVSYVVFSIAVSVRVLDLELMASLPTLIEPFVPLNPMVAAMVINATATGWNGAGRRERAHEAFSQVFTALDAVSGAELAYVTKVRASLSQTLGGIDASLGIQSPWTDRLAHDEQDPNQKVGARYLRKVAALQQGDWEAAESHRQQAELLTLQSKARPMFSTLGEELEAHAMARDLTGLKQVRAGIHAMAASHPGWEPVMHVADAHYLRLCGDLDGARRAAEAVRQGGGTGSVRSPWVFQAVTVEAEVLVELGRAGEALALAETSLSECQREGMRYLARGLSCVVALAEAKLGQLDAAMARLEEVISEQRALGVTGLQLGRSYELCARVAIGGGDPVAFEKFSTLTAKQYRPGKSSVLGALYERLMEDARRAGIGEAASEVFQGAQENWVTSAQTRVTTAMAGCTESEERAQRALRLLCDGDPPGRGFLFVVTGGGLEFAAANTPCGCLPDVLAFAEGRLAIELASEESLTAVVETKTFDMSSAMAEWQDQGGTRYTALILGALLDGAFRTAGVAVLSERWPTGVPGLTEAVAKSLIASAPGWS
jgi:hypothetical protein